MDGHRRGVRYNRGSVDAQSLHEAIMESDPQSWNRGRFWPWALAITLAAALLRWPAMSTAFWLDEIWSWEMARSVASLGEIFTADLLRLDNNHHLSSVWLYLLGDREGWLGYRFLAFSTGVLSVLAAAWIGRLHSLWAGIASGGLFAGSFFLIVYSTEARGYGPAVCFALCALLALHRYTARPSLLWAALFWWCVVLGLLSHFSFAHFYLGTMAWSAYRAFRRSESLREGLTASGRLHAVPATFALVMYAVMIRPAGIGGGDAWQWHQIVVDALAWTLGAPLTDPTPLATAVLALTAVLLVLAWDARMLHREGSDQWVIYVMTVFVSPALIWVVLQPAVLYPRYFLLPLALLLLVLGRCLGRLAVSGRWHAVAAATLAAIFVVGNARHLTTFLDHGRGGYPQALQDLATESESDEIHVGVDHPFRTPLVLSFYCRGLPAGKQLMVWSPAPPVPVAVPDRLTIRHGSGPKEGLDWILLHSNERHPPQPIGVEALGHTFRLYRQYPYYGPSGTHWFLYRRAR